MSLIHTQGKVTFESIVSIALSLITMGGMIITGTSIVNSYDFRLEKLSDNIAGIEEERQQFRVEYIQAIKDQNVKMDNLTNKVADVQKSADTTAALVKYYIAPKFGATPQTVQIIEKQSARDNPQNATTT